MLASPFKSVMIADADAVFLQPPEVFWEEEVYERTGTLFFRDRKIFPGDDNVRKLIEISDPLSVMLDSLSIDRWWRKIMENRTPSEEMMKSPFYLNHESREEQEVSFPVATSFNILKLILTERSGPNR
jgi:hypothetical protein